ncbi:MAG: hypothetical protein ACM31C_33300 [Acidobacteriota bacterium]
MKLIVVAMLASAPAWADPAERCAAGVAFEQKGDLSRAALYLEGCDDAQLAPELADAVGRASRELHKKLDASDLAVVDVISKPAGLDATIDALPGEHFTTPATLYVPAGHHALTVGGTTVTVDTKPRARSPVLVDRHVPPAPPPQDHRVDFNEGGGGPEAEQQVAPPPDQKHPPLTPCKYSNSCTEAGSAIDDPLAEHASPPPEYPAVAMELRAGAAYASALEPSIGGVFAMRLGEAEPHPWVAWGRLGWSRRPDAKSWGGSIEGTEAIEKVIAAADTAWLALGAGFTQDTYGGVGASALVELSLRRLPITLGAQYEQSFETSSMGTLPHVFVLELGGGWRDH